MRIKKPNSKVNQDITFDTIAERNEAAKTLIDGDLVKVLDASNDPLIESGWAVYRYCYETRTFDLVEKEEQEKIDILTPDHITTTEGLDWSGSGSTRITSPMLMNFASQNLEILEDFDLDFSFNQNDLDRNRFRFEIAGTTPQDRCYHIPINTAFGKKYLRIGRGVCSTPANLDKSYSHWGFMGEIVDSIDTTKYVSWHVNAASDGNCPHYNQETEPNTGLRIPAFIIRCQLNDAGQWDFSKVKVFKLWKKHLKKETAAAIEIDGKTIVEDSAKKLTSFHNLNHGAGFEFPEPIKMVFEPSGDSKSYDIKWSGMKNGIDVFGYNGHDYPLGITTKQVYSLQAKDNCDTLGFTHYVRVSCHAGVVYWSSHIDYLTDIPSLEMFDYNGKQFLPLAFIKLVYNPDYTMDLTKCQVSHIYRNGVLIEEEANTAHGFKSYANYILANNDKLNLKDGQFIKVLDASLDIRVGSVIWAVYRWDEANKQLVIMSVEDSTPESKTFGTITVRDGLKASCVDNELVKVVDATADPEVSEGWAFYRYVAKYKTFDLVSKKPTAGATPAKIYPDGYTIDEYDINDGERPTFAVIDAMKSFRNDQILLEDFEWEVSYIDYSDSFFFTPSKKGKVPILINGVKKYLVLAEGGFKRNLLPADCNTAYLTVTGTIVDTLEDSHNTINCGYSSGECHQIRPRSEDFNSNVVLFQARVAVPALGGTIDKQSIYMSKYWKRALNVGAIPTADINTIERSSAALFSNQFSVPDAMHSFRQNQSVLKDFDFDFSHDKDTKIITMTIRGGGSFTAIPILLSGVRKYLHLNTMTFDLSNFHYSVERFHFVVSAPIRDTSVFSTNGMSNQYDSSNGSVADVKPRTTSTSVALFQVSGTMPTLGNELLAHEFVVHKYWKKALASFNDLYTEMMP